MANEGLDGKHPAYAERLWPSLGMWSFALIMTVSLGIAYGRAYGLSVGIYVGAAATIVVLFGMTIGTPAIAVDELNFRAGRARMPLQYVGQVRILSNNESRRARSVDAHKDAYFQLRGGIKKTLIIEITDETDPHPYWQVSSRRPEDLATALTAAKSQISHL